jgi:hypothetical protein
MLKLSKFIIPVSSIVAFALLSGCSVYFAATGSKDVDLSKVNRGVERYLVEGELGSPLEIKPSSQGEAALYTYKIGDPPAPGRALLYLLGDIVTFCLAEYVFFPLEISNSGDAQYLRVDYDKNEKVTQVSRVKDMGTTSALQ